ncbi:MAG: AAA family ATPase [Chloroflexi bacterium]|nr:AAA family ATPase [Chloroflexota bacterium]
MDRSSRIQLLGTFSLEFHGRLVTIASPRLQALLAHLILNRSEAHTRQRLAFLLWPDSSESQAHTNLRTLIHRLYSVFPEAGDLLDIDTHTLALRDASAQIDVGEFEEAAKEAAVWTNDPSAVATLERAVNAYTGDLLPECYDEWLLPERDRLRTLYLTVLEQLATRLEQGRQYGPALVQARKLAHLDPTNEIACLMLMRLHLLTGDPASALRAYHTCVTALRTELGAEPGDKLTGAYQRLVAAETPLPSTRTPVTMHALLPLVGRDREWRRLQTAWQAANAGQPRLLLVWGEAGIGKTRLAEELLQWAGRQGIITATGRCYAAEGELTFAPVTAIIQADRLRAGLSHLDAEWKAEITRLIPDLPVSGPLARTSDTLPPHWKRQRLFEGLARAVLGAGRPVILLFDDLQWCDRDSLEWLHFLLRHDPQGRLLIIGTVRVEEVTAEHALHPLLDSLRRESRVVEMTLGPLSRQETAELAGHVARHALEVAAADALFDETEGNPLFVVEMLRAGAREDAEELNSVPAAGHPAASTQVGLPPGIHATVARRLRQLTPAAQALVEAAAVIGRSFTFPVVAQTVDLDPGAVVRALDELWQRHIVREHGQDAYDFTHGKLCAVAYTDLSSARRKHLHRRVAEALEAAYLPDVGPVSGQIALHFERAGMPTRARSYHQQAAAYSRKLFANEIAIAHYRHALALTPPAEQGDRAALYDQLGEVLHFIGRYEEAREAWSNAIAAHSTGDPVTLAERYRKLGNAWRDHYRYEEALEQYALAEATLGPLDSAAEEVWLCWGHIQMERINVYYWLAQVDAMMQLVNLVHEVFEQHKLLTQRAHLYQVVMMAHLRQSRYSPNAEAIEYGRAFLETIEAAGETESVPAAHFQFGFALLWGGGEPEEVRNELHLALTLAEQSGDVSLVARSLTYLTVWARLRGLQDETLAYAERSLHTAEAAHMPEYVGSAKATLGWLAWREGRWPTARALVGDSIRIWEEHAARYMFQWLGRWPHLALELADGALEGAVEDARVLLDPVQKRMPDPIETVLAVGVAAFDRGEKAASAEALQVAVDCARQDGYL